MMSAEVTNAPMMDDNVRPLGFPIVGAEAIERRSRQVSKEVKFGNFAL